MEDLRERGLELRPSWELTESLSSEVRLAMSSQSESERLSNSDIGVEKGWDERQDDACAQPYVVIHQRSGSPDALLFLDCCSFQPLKTHIVCKEYHVCLYRPEDTHACRVIH